MQDFQIEIIRHIDVFHVVTAKNIVTVSKKYRGKRDEVGKRFHNIPTRKTSQMDDAYAE